MTAPGEKQCDAAGRCGKDATGGTRLLKPIEVQHGGERSRGARRERSDEARASRLRDGDVERNSNGIGWHARG